MKFLFSFPAPLLKALSGWLLHSLWAGVLLALLVSLVMLATRGSAARKRYNLLLACLGLFALLMAVILGVGLVPLFQTADYPAVSGTLAGTPVYMPATAHLPAGGIIGKIAALVDAYAPAIVSAWMIVVLVRSIRLAGGLYNVHRLRTSGNEQAPLAWQQRLEQLAVQLGVSKSVRLLQSHAVTVPMVIGHFKPLVLLPFSLVSSLPPAQVEAILLHELAHIARRDYLVNLLVNLLETVFFFNPAVIWVASLLRKERENCCDDITIGLVSDPRDYIEALLWCQQEQDQTPALAVALLDQPRHLLGRVRRMIYKHKNRSLNNMEKSIVSISLVTAGLLALAFTGKDESSSKTPLVKTALPKCPENASVFQKDYWNRQYAVRDTVPPPPPPSAPAAPAPGTGKPAVPAAPPPASGTTAVPAAPPTPPADGTPSRPPAAATPKPAPAGLNVPLPPAAPLSPAHSGTTPAAAPLPPLPVTDAIDTKLSVPVNTKVVVITNVPGNPADHYFPPPATPREAESNEQREKILREMVADGIITENFKELSFKLSTTEFIVNGKRQHAATFEKYRKEYVKQTGKGEWSWYYNYDTQTTVR